MAIGAIIVTSLSYASQMSVAEYVCNAERFDNKAGPFVGLIMETILRMQNGKQDSMPTKRDRNQWTDVWEHRQEISWCCDSEVEVR